MPGDVFNAFMNYAAKNNVKGNEEEVNRARHFIELRIKAFFAREKFSSDSFYPVVNDEDPVIRAAMQSMKKEVTAFNGSASQRAKK